ncbi:MAG: DUF3820 family protein [Bacteroidia bacterium]|nr:DUF3820 family protein [Bacteroidia bacterium]
MDPAPISDSKVLLEIVSTKMPFGRYEGTLICDLPESYIVWFKQKGFPKGRLGILLETMYEIELNGLNELLRPLKANFRG